MARRPVKHAAAIPEKYTIDSRDETYRKLPSSMIVTPKMAGTDNKKENRAEVFPVSPLNSPAAMVEPEREIPGIRAIP